MVLAPRSATRSGLSTQGTLLLVLGGAAALFLLFLLPRLTTSRTAEARGQSRAVAEEPREGTKPPAEAHPLVALPEQPSEASSSGAKGQVGPASDASGRGAALAATPSKTIEDPSLKRLNDSGWGERIQPGALRAEQREKRKERQARAAEEAALQGLEPPPSPKPKPAFSERQNEMKKLGNRGQRPQPTQERPAGKKLKQ
jgi:hypothetical protein